jgi:hypothetical protein
MPISNFKALALKHTEGQLVSANAKYIAYTVGRKKIRLLGQEAGQKGLMSGHAQSESDLVALALNGDLLASLAESGNLMVGSVYEESREALGYEAIAQSTMHFPDIAPARGLVWTPSGAPLRALLVHGDSPSAFVLWMDPKPLAVELDHGLDGAIEAAAFYGPAGQFLAVADKSMVECFAVDYRTRTFTPILKYSLALITAARVWLFADGEEGLVISALSGPLSAFVSATVRGVQEPFWISSALGFAQPGQVSCIFDPLMQVFLLASMNEQQFHVLALRSDANGFAHMKGEWREKLPLLSIALCPELRDIPKGVHIPLYLYQSEWVHFYALTLPKPGEEEASLEPVYPVAAEAKPVSSSPLVKAKEAEKKTPTKAKPVVAKQPAAPLQPSQPQAPQLPDQIDLAGIVKKSVAEEMEKLSNKQALKGIASQLVAEAQQAPMQQPTRQAQAPVQIDVEGIVDGAMLRVEKRIEATVKEILLNHLVPAVEASCGELLQQLAKQKQSDTAALETKIDALQAAVEKIIGCVSSLPSAKDLEQLAASAAESHRGSVNFAHPIQQAASVEDLQRAELEQLVATGASHEALLKALDFGNLDILTGLLAKLDPIGVLESSEAATCLSLAQQLGSDLTAAAALKLDWLSEIFTIGLVLPPGDTQFAALATEVFEELFNNLRVFLAQNSADAVLAKKAKTVMRLVRMFL